MPKIYTIGSSDRRQEEFVNLLTEHKIKVLVDVRRFPTSKYEHFKKENLSKLLEQEGIEYIYFGKDLGGFRTGGYEAYTQTQEYKKAINVLNNIAKDKTVCLMCAEKDPRACHRRFISETLKLQGNEIFDII